LLDPWRDIDTIDDVLAVADRIETLPGRRTAEAIALLGLGSNGNHAAITEEVRTS